MSANVAADTLGHLQFQELRRQAGETQSMLYHFEKAVTAELQRRDVHRHRQLAARAGMHLGDFTAGLIQYPAPQGDDLSDTFGQGDELCRGDHAAGRVSPVQQGFDTACAPAHGIDHWLVVDFKLTLS